MEIGVPGVVGAEKVGEGAFGVVYRARQESFNRLVAVKVLANVDLTEEANKRFAREVSAVGRLSGHPNIVNVFESGVTEGGAPYLLMEYCGRGSYGDALKRGHRYNWDEATSVAISVAGALESSHRAGIVHRDVKPDNILIDGYGAPRLADFGVARAAAQTAMTAVGSLVGSLAYIAPETVVGEEPSPASDLYSLAATIYTMITGAPPFVRSTDTSIAPLLLRIAQDNPPRLHEHGVPAEIADVMLRAMAKSPSDRQSSCADFAEELRSARHAVGLARSSFQVVGPEVGSSAGSAADETNVAPVGVGPEVGRSGPNWAGGPPSPIPTGPPPGRPTTPGGTRYPPGDSLPPIPPPETQAEPKKRSRRPLLMGLGAAAAVIVALGIVGVVAFTGGGDTPPPPPTPGLTDQRAAELLQLTAAELANLSGSNWEQSAEDSINPTGAFCNEVHQKIPREFEDRGFHLAGGQPDSLLSVTTAGAVFETARDAEGYQREQRDSAECGTYSDGVNSLFVSMPPADPMLVGCRCQNVAVFETVITPPDGGRPATQFFVQAQQDRYLAGTFFTFPGTLEESDAAILFIDDLVDAVVKKVSDVAEEANEGNE